MSPRFNYVLLLKNCMKSSWPSTFAVSFGRGSGVAPKVVLCLLSACGDGGKNEAQRPTEYPDPFKQPPFPWLLNGGAPKKEL